MDFIIFSFLRIQVVFFTLLMYRDFLILLSKYKENLFHSLFLNWQLSAVGTQIQNDVGSEIGLP